MKAKKNLRRLLENVPHTHLSGPVPADVELSAVIVDSREAAGGACFVAVAGMRDDGHSYVGDAVRGGCSAVIVEQGKLTAAECAGPGVCVLGVDDTRTAVGEIASAFYDRPEREIRLIGVTGTNGKTTVSYLLETILVDQGHSVGVIGTVNYRYMDGAGNNLQLAALYTTPEPLLLERLLRQMADAGVDTVVMEVSSHALAQRRLGRLAFDVAVFTNLSQDHLDYHRTMESYFQAKTLLFLYHLKKDGAAVISHGGCQGCQMGSWPRLLSAILRQNNIRVAASGLTEESVITPRSIIVDTGGTHLSLDTPQGRYDLSSPLVGDFNAANIMTAMAVSVALRLDMPQTVASLAKGTGAPGRLEKITLEATVEVEKAAVFVDYAHTPDALQNILTTLSGLPHERLICVFGCGGDRDRGKRAMMGAIAARHADIVIVTDDNPRSEPSDQIIDEIMQGIRQENLAEQGQDWIFNRGARKGCVVIADRRQAIHTAVAVAGEKDVVVIAGKGHEKYQITNQGRRFFDDAMEVREAMLSWDDKSVSAALEPLACQKSGPTRFIGISTDTRSLRQKELFVALRGDSFDGHDYVNVALERGAAGAVVEKGGLPKKDFPAAKAAFFLVEDTLEALGNLARYRRKIVRQLSAPVVVGITGSTGKTTVKEMVAAIFARRWPDTPLAPAGRVLKTSGNFNNLVGLPLCLLPLQLKHRAAVLEMGMNQPGEIARLTEIADPDIGCIVNVHGAHLEGLGSIDGVAREKAALFAGMAEAGTLVVNLDDRYVRQAAASCRHRKVSWTVEKQRKDEADVAAFGINCGDDGKMAFNLQIGGRTVDVNLQVPGRHNVANGAAAAAIAHAAGIPPETIARGLESFSSTSRRLQVTPAAGGYTILDDTYNANPASMAAGLAALADMGGGSKVAVLGDMLELGQASEDAHRQVGELAASVGLVRLAVVGEYAGHMAAAAIAAGMSEDKVMVFSNKDDIPAWIRNLQAEGVLSEASWVLVKASRGLRLESVVERLAAVQTT